jgi:hypothetical protein
MNRKQFMLLFVMAVVIGCAGVIVLKRAKQTWTVRETKMGEKVLPNFRVNEVAAIHVGGHSEFNVALTNGLWRVRERGDYPANYNQIKDLLMKLAEIKVVESDLVGPSQLERLQLKPPGTGGATGTLFEFKDAQGNPLASLLAGKKHDRPHNASEPRGLRGLFDGCYVLLPSDPGRVLLISDELISAAPEPGMWLNPEFFKVENIKFISLLSTNAADSWEISRENPSSPWVLADSKPGETLDTKVASDAAEILAFPTFVDVVPPNQTGAMNLSHPAKLVTAITDTSAYTLRLSPKRSDGTYLMKVAVAASAPTVANPPAEAQETKQVADDLAKERGFASRVYVVDSWIEMVIRDRAQLLQKPTVAEQSADPATR